MLYKANHLCILCVCMQLGNGYLSFEDPDYFNETFSIQDGFPIDTPLIAPLITPFLSDLYEYSSTRLFRVTTNNNTIQRVREEVASAFPELPTFSATQVLIATWIPLNDTVSYQNIYKDDNILTP